MKRILGAFIVLTLSLVIGGRILLGQGQGQGAGNADHDPFIDHSERGETIHVLPTHAAAASQSAHGPYSLAPSGRGTSVYAASYGTGSVVDHGGLEIANAGFVPIYWNASVASSPATSLGYTSIAAEIRAFVTRFADGSDWNGSATDDYTIIQQYGSRAPISSALAVSADVVDTRTTASSITDASIRAYLGTLFSSVSPAPHVAPNPNVIYGVYFPPGMKVQLSGTSCSSFCGYHSHFTYAGVQIKYAVFPYLDCSACKLSSLTVADMLTIVTSHEIREAVTDPGDFNQYGWYDRRGYEADDKCAWHNLYQMSNGGFWVQPEYSNGGTRTGSGLTRTWPGPGCVVPR